MELEYEAKDVRADPCRIRSNLCELPTTYITNNCQMTKLSGCASEFADSPERGVKCCDFSAQNFGGMAERHERLCKLPPRAEEHPRSAAGKLDSLKPHMVKPAPKQLKPTFSAEPLFNFQAPSNHRQLNNLVLRNRSCGDHRAGHDVQLRPLPRKPNVIEVKFQEVQEAAHGHNIQYDTCTFFNKKVDVVNLRERYTREVELLKEKLRDLKNNAYVDQEKAKAASAPIRREGTAKLAPLHELRSRNLANGGDADFRRAQSVLVSDATGAVPRVPAISRSEARPEPTPTAQAKRDRLKSASKVSLKTKAKLSNTKLKKPRSKVCSSIACNSDLSDSDCSGSEDSDREGNHLDGSESLDDASVASSLRDAPSKVAHLGAGGDSVNWPLRASLFPHIPPYLCFMLHDAASPQRIPMGARYLKWKMSTITPILVRKTLTNSGFRLVRSEFSRESNEWVGTWGKHMKSPMFKTLKDTQKLNHFPGTFQIGRKDRLWRNLQKLIVKHGHKEFGFIPQTYVLPQDLKLLKQHWQNKNGSGDEKYIIKPPASARGTGIKVINRWSQLPKRMSLVVQEYIASPYLINGSKFDLRLYVLVTSFNPLRIYLYPDGLARFASVPYSDDVKDLKDRYMHLTNYSINKMSSMYTANEDANACKGHKWTLSKLWEYMEKKGIDTKALWKNLEQLVIKTLISGESAIVPLCRENMNSRYNCYELFGVDVLLDHHLKAWLLEVNISPSLHSQSPLDEHVKGPLVKSLFELAQFHLPPRLGKIETKSTPVCYDPRLYTTTLTKKERNKHNYFCQADSRREYLEDILADLTGDDVRHLTQAEDELAAVGRFARIFPTAGTHKYLDFLDVRYYNRLFDAWECKYEKNRQPGIDTLLELCEQKVHLKVAPPTVLNKSSPNLIPGEPSLQPSKEGQTMPATVTPSTVPAVAPVQQAAAADRANAAPNKTCMDVKSLYNALRIQSERGNMVLRPFPRSNYSTQV